MTRDAVLKQALRLTVEDRADVAERLLASLDEASSEDPEALEKAWAIEIEHRGRRVLADESSGSSWGEARQRIEARLASK